MARVTFLFLITRLFLIESELIASFFGRFDRGLQPGAECIRWAHASGTIQSGRRGVLDASAAWKGVDA